MQNRFKSKLFWVGVLSVIMLIMGNYGLYNLIGMTEDIFGTIATKILDLIFVAGIITAGANNPTDKENF